MTLPGGIYDLLVTDALAKKIDPDQSSFHHLQGDASELLSDLIGRQLSSILAALPSNDADRTNSQLELVNQLLTQVRKTLTGKIDDATADALVDLVSSPTRQL